MDMPLTHAWQSLYPPRQCHAQGWLDVGAGHELYWEECGNPVGPAALFLHGGPGAGCTPDDRRWFDPLRWRIVLFDQRGAGRSRATDRLAANTTEHLVQDIESLRRHLQIERWLLFGGSWGATLALAYAQRHAERVSALVLRGVFTATAQELRWLHSRPCKSPATRMNACDPGKPRTWASTTDVFKEDSFMLEQQQLRLENFDTRQLRNFNTDAAPVQMERALEERIRQEQEAIQA